MNINTASVRKSNVEHDKDSKKLWYEAMSLVNLLAVYASPEGYVPQKYKPAFFYKSVMGISRNTYYKHLAYAKEQGWVSYGQSREGDGKFTQGKVVLTAPWLSYFVKHGTGAVELDEAAEEPCTKIWDSEASGRVPNNGIPLNGTVIDIYSKEKSTMVSGKEPTTIQEGPTGSPQGVNTGKENTQAEYSEPEPHIKDKSISSNFKYVGKFPHTWRAEYMGEYEWKEWVYEAMMRDNKIRKQLEQASRSDLYTPDEFVHELLDGWYKNQIRISEKLYGVSKLIEKHEEFMTGTWGKLPKQAPDGELREAADKIINFTKAAWPWFGHTKYGDQIEEAEEKEFEALLSFARSKRLTMGQLRTAVAVVTFSQDRAFGHFHDYITDKHYANDILEVIERNIEYAQEYAQKSKRNYAKVQELNLYLDDIGAGYKVKL